MHPVAILDLVAFLATLFALAVLCWGWRRGLPEDIKLLVFGLLLFTTFHHLSNILEWSGIDKTLDPFEDFIEILTPAFWFFIFYAFFKNTAAQDLRENQRRFKESQEIARLGQWELDLVTNRLYWSEGIYQLFEVDPEAFGASYEAFLEKVHPEDRAFVDKAYTESVKNKTPYDIIHRFLLKDGKVKYVRELCRTEYDEGGNPLRSLGTVQDISELAQAQEPLKESHEQLRELAALLPEPIFEMGTEGRLTYVNNSALEVFGYTMEDFLQGKNAFEIISAQEHPRMAENIQRVLSGENMGLREYTALKKDGTPFPVLLNATAIFRGGEAVGIRGIIVDISEKKKAEQAVIESEMKFRSLFDLSPQAIALTDLEEGRLIDVNRTFCELTGYAKEAAVGRTTTGLGFYSEEDRRRFVQGLQSTGEVHGMEMAFTARDGQVLNAVMFARFIQIAEKSYVLTVFLDVTEQKRLESQLQRAQKMEAIGSLAGGVAHDLNNVLSGIVGYPDLLLLQLPEDSPLRKPILTIQDSGKKAAAIVQDLLTLARRGVATMEVFNVNDIILDFLKSPECQKLKQLHEGVEIRTDLAGDLMNVSGSTVHVSKTLMNLLSNAAEAMPGGGEITVSTENRYLDRTVSGYDRIEQGDYMVLAVSDTGMGIPRKDYKKIFEPFYTKKRMGRSGTGLGMAVVWGVVKDHKGYIDVQSTQGKGTTFTLYFPATRQPLKEAPSSVPLADYTGHGESILVVDDIREQRQIASQMLKQLGYRVTSVSSGEEALSYLRKENADLLILDMIMDPGMDGLETYRKILEGCPGQKAILASGFSETDRVREAQRLGAGPYIKKPYTLEKIGITVKKVLGEETTG